MNDPEAARHDAVLVARALRDEGAAAFGQLVRRHQGAVRAQLRRLTAGDEAWADDLAQETFLQAWRKLEQFRAEARFSTWLYRIAYTAFLQAIRGRRLATVRDPAAETPSFDESRGLDLRHDLEQAMRRLPEMERRALTMCYDLGLSHEEAAYVLGIPAGTVKTHVARGKARLRESLSAWAESPDGLSGR
jgi:RNA polymerase sigma-70 factor, ECF subfamily